MQVDMVPRILPLVLAVGIAGAQQAPALVVQSGVYHLAGCRILSRDFPVTPVTAEKVIADRLFSCAVCKPDESEVIRTAMAADRAARAERAAMTEKERVAEEERARIQREKDAAEAAEFLAKEKARIEAAIAAERTRPHVALTESQARQIAASVAKELGPGGDPSDFKSRFEQAAKKFAPDFDADGTGTVYYSSDLFVGLASPAVLFVFSAADQLRKLEPVATAPWAAGVVTITVSPSTIDSPNIIKVVVMRNGKIVPPLRSTLKPTVNRTRMGATFVVNEGNVVYPISAFAPNADSVTITLVPASGSNIVKEFTRDELRRIQ